MALARSGHGDQTQMSCAWLIPINNQRRQILSEHPLLLQDPCPGLPCMQAAVSNPILMIGKGWRRIKCYWQWLCMPIEQSGRR